MIAAHNRFGLIGFCAATKFIAKSYWKAWFSSKWAAVCVDQCGNGIKPRFAQFRMRKLLLFNRQLLATCTAIEPKWTNNTDLLRQTEIKADAGRKLHCACNWRTKLAGIAWWLPAIKVGYAIVYFNYIQMYPEEFSLRAMHKLWKWENARSIPACIRRC